MTPLAEQVLSLAGQAPIALLSVAIAIYAAIGAGFAAPARVLAAVSALTFAAATITPTVVIFGVEAAGAIIWFSESGAWTAVTLGSACLRALAILGFGGAIAWRRG